MSDDSSVARWCLLWQHDIGIARRTTIEVFPLGTDGHSSVVLAAHTDTRTVEAFELEFGDKVGVINDVWPTSETISPQSVTFDPCDGSAVFSSLSSTGESTIAQIDLKTWLNDLKSQKSIIASADASGRRARSHNMLRGILPVAAADIFVAIATEGSKLEWLEIWDRDALDSGEELNIKCLHRIRSNSLANPRLVAAGAQHVALLDSAAFMRRGEMIVLAWGTQSSQAQSYELHAGRKGRSDSFCLDGMVQWWL
jgi:hypothetical protein